MDVGSLNEQAYNPIPMQDAQPREAAEPAASNAAQTSQVVVEPEKSALVDEKKDGRTLEKLDDRQIEDMLSKGIKEANKRLTVTSNMLQYSYHKPTRSVAVQVINADTKEVVREIPPIKALDALAKVWELAGILVDERK